MRVAMIGAGYVGLASASCISEFGFTVTCVDTEPERIAALREGRVPIYEPGLEPLLAANVAAGRLCFTEDFADAVPHALRLMVSPAGSAGACLVRVRPEALPATCRPVAGAGYLLVTLAVPLQCFSSWARTGPHRFPGEPSRGSAPFQDPG